MAMMTAWGAETYKNPRSGIDKMKRQEPTITMLKCPVCGKGFLSAKPFGIDRERLLNIKGTRKFFCSHCGKETEAMETELMSIGPEKEWGYVANGKVLEKCSEEEMTEFVQELTDGLTKEEREKKKEEREKKKEVDYHKWVSENGGFLLRFLEENGFVKREETLFGI